MRIKPLARESIDYIFGNLWQRGRDEAKAFDVSLDNLKQNFLNMIGKPWALAFYKKYDGVPCALCFLDPIGIYRWRTHFAATEEGFNIIWIPLTVFFKRISDSLVAEGDGKGCIEIYADHSNQKAAEWYTFLLLPHK